MVFVFGDDTWDVRSMIYLNSRLHTSRCKTANIATGRRDQVIFIIHIFDFGLSRESFIRNNGSVKLRMTRTNTMFQLAQYNLAFRGYPYKLNIRTYWLLHIIYFYNFGTHESKDYSCAVRYCSANIHTRGEQGRPDDLWSMVYVLVEMRLIENFKGKYENGKAKFQTLDTTLFGITFKELLDVSFCFL
ncbi:unnamed protein product [Onchocerca flexuosa]|uniref:DEP domain-containing protein n=1 Tax=Onchocerca flexuosa TaxID=387005 RepID=A0A183HB54_9BILA|nr:unnamed protein product [Onchocerca flexuosa]